MRELKGGLRKGLFLRDGVGGRGVEEERNGPPGGIPPHGKRSRGPYGEYIMNVSYVEALPYPIYTL